MSACDRQPALTHHRLAVFGTEVTVTLRTDKDTDAVVAAVDRELQIMHRRWHAWEAGLLTDINHALAEGGESSCRQTPWP